MMGVARQAQRYGGKAIARMVNNDTGEPASHRLRAVMSGPIKLLIEIKESKPALTRTDPICPGEE